MYTLSLHNEGSKMSQRHNIRAPKSIGNKDIDSELSKTNIVLEHKDIRREYKRLFQAAVDEYNSKQKHQDRIIKDYYNHIQKSKKHTCYEMIIQIGSKDEGSPKLPELVFIDYVDQWKKRNPNLILIGAYIHNDEATPHMHIDYIPVCQSNRGMSIQNSLTGALKAQGFVTHSKKDTAQIQWEQSERDCIRELCKQYQIPLFEQGIGRKRHFTIQEYKDLQDELNSLKSQIKPLREENQKLQNDNNILQTKNEELKYQNQAYQQQVNGLRQQNRQQIETYKEIKGQTIKLKDINNDLRQENRSLFKDKKRLSKDIEDLQSGIDYIGNAIDDILGQELQNQVDELRDSYNQNNYIYNYDDMER